MANSAAAVVDFSQPKVGALIRARRRQLHMTLEEICQAAGISKGYLSQVERDQATPSLGTLAQIARSLDVGMDYFIATPSVENSLTRAEERPKFSVDGSSMQIRDTAQLEIQLLDGDKVVSSETATINYVALLTPAENGWRVRVLEAVSQ